MSDSTTYLDGKVPASYKCSRCGAAGCKLWRPSALENARLLCADCAAGEEKDDISGIDENGRFTDKNGITSNQIGWMVPSIPSEDSSFFWFYTLAPDSGRKWWLKLPTRPQK